MTSERAGDVAVPRASRGTAVSALAFAYLAFLPLGQMVVVPVAGAMATVSDLVLVALVLAAGMAFLAGLAGSDGMPRGGGLRGEARAALALLVVFGVWVGATAAWSFNPGYAGAKGVGTLLLAMGVWALATARLPASRLADAWLVGATVALLATFLLAVVGPEVLRQRVVYDAGAVDGLPFPRFRGPFVHPNLLGDYLAVTAVLLWARWPEWTRAGASGTARALAPLLVGLLALGLGLSVSSGWLTLGGAAVALAFAAPGWRRPLRWGLGAAAVALLLPTALGLLTAVDVSVGPFTIRTGGIRLEIWAGAAAAVMEAPLFGVGAAPYLSETIDPLGGGGMALWDAHSAYLSVAGQFGIVGTVLFFGGLALGMRCAYRAGLTAASSVEGTTEVPRSAVARHRLAVAVLAAVCGLLLHWTSIAGEDARHVWALLGIALALVAAPDSDRQVDARSGS